MTGNTTDKFIKFFFNIINKIVKKIFNIIYYIGYCLFYTRKIYYFFYSFPIHRLTAEAQIVGVFGWAVFAVGKQITACYSDIIGCIRIQKPCGFGVVVAGLQVVKARFGIKVITSVAEWVYYGNSNSVERTITPLSYV